MHYQDQFFRDSPVCDRHANHSKPISATDLIDQSVIPGFSAIVTYAWSRDIKPEDAYLCALLYMYDLASDDWDATIQSGIETYTKEIGGIKIAIGSDAGPGDQYQLQNKYLVLGLLKVMNSLESRKAFCNAKAKLFVYFRPVGVLAMGHPIYVGVNGTNAKLIDVDPIPTLVTESRNLTVPGEIVDPEDSNFVISYQMLEDPISCRALFNAALNAMANTAPIENDYPCTNFNGLSSSGKVTYSIGRSPPGTSRLLLTYGLVKTALKLLPAVLYLGESCGEVRFDLTYAGEDLGGGSFFLT